MRVSVAACPGLLVRVACLGFFGRLNRIYKRGSRLPVPPHPVGRAKYSAVLDQTFLDGRPEIEQAERR
jgi:hypothetical protein